MPPKYLPARAQSGASAVVTYSIYDEETRRYRRYRTKFNRIKSDRDRQDAMKAFCEEINKKLRSGWTPESDQRHRNANKTLTEACEYYLDNCLPPRADSVRTYTSVVRIFLKWSSAKKLADRPADCFAKADAVDFIHESTRTKKLSARTHNNYINVMRAVFNHLIENQFAMVNPFIGLKKKKAEGKNRRSIPSDLLKSTFAYMRKENPRFRIACELILYCGIRPAEICRMKIYNILSDKSCISFDAAQTKNGRSEFVTVPTELMKELRVHIHDAHPDSYVFGKDTMLSPGRRKLNPRTLSKHWDKVRDRMRLPQEYKLYSLKDTGAIMMAGMMSPNSLKLQFRHSHLGVTENYLNKSTPSANPEILSLNFLD